MPTTSYTFTNSANYTNSNTEVIEGSASLTTTTQAYNYPILFTSDTGMTYDSSKSEFASSVARQTNQYLPSTFVATYSNSIDANYSVGSGTGVATNGAAIVNEYLDLTHNDIRYVTYTSDSSTNWDLSTEGAIRLKFIPNYSGTPVDMMCLCSFSDGVFSKNITEIMHKTNGHLTARVYSSSGSAILEIGTTFSPVSGTEYIIEFNMDLTTGASRFFVDGTQLGLTSSVISAARTSPTHLKIGTVYNGSYKSNFKIADFQIFPTPQHTANHSASYTLPETVYSETTITTPELAHTGPGTITAFNSFASTNSNAKFTININQSGNYLYWNGANWAVSNGTYAQSTDASTFNANVGSLPILGASYGQFKVHFPDQNTQGSVTSLTANTQESSYHLSGWVKTSSGISISSLTSLTETVTKPTNTNIQYVIELNGSPRYWNGSSWATSDLSFTQSNSIATLTSNLSTLTPTNSTARFYAILNTTDEKITPSIDNLEVVSDFGGVVTDTPETCIVYGYIKDLGANPISGVTVTVQLSEDATEYREAASNLTSNKLVTTSDVNGYWSFSLIRSSEFEGSGTYKISFLKSGVLNIKTNGGNPITFQVPDQTSVDLSSIIGDV